MYPEEISRQNPVISSFITALFPGYVLWRKDRKIEALSITAAAYLGYLMVIGFLITLYFLYYNWKKVREHNQSHGYEELTEGESYIVTVTGIAGGILGHPIYLLLALLWLERGQLNGTDPVGADPILYFLTLILIFGLRMVLFVNLSKVKHKKEDPQYLNDGKVFAQQHASMIITTPLYILLASLTPSDIFYGFLVPLSLGLGIIFGGRVLFNIRNRLNYSF